MYSPSGISVSANRPGSSIAEVNVIATGRADPGHRHQPTAGRVLANHAQHGPVQRVVFGAQRLACPQHRLDHPFQHRLAGHELADAAREPALAHDADLQPEAAQDAPDAQLDIQELTLQELAPVLHKFI